MLAFWSDKFNYLHFVLVVLAVVFLSSAIESCSKTEVPSKNSGTEVSKEEEKTKAKTQVKFNNSSTFNPNTSFDYYNATTGVSGKIDPFSTGVYTSDMDLAPDKTNEIYIFYFDIDAQCCSLNKNVVTIDYSEGQPTVYCDYVAIEPGATSVDCNMTLAYGAVFIIEDLANRRETNYLADFKDDKVQDIVVKCDFTLNKEGHIQWIESTKGYGKMKIGSSSALYMIPQTLTQPVLVNQNGDVKPINNYKYQQ